MRAPLRLALAAALLMPVAAFAQSASEFNGARYIHLENLPGGKELLSFYRINGSTVINTTQLRNRGSSQHTYEPTTYPILNGTFYIAIPADVCLAGFNTDDCGHRGTIKNDAIYFTPVLNGQPSDRVPPRPAAKRQY
jgi:hypothetical protein